MGSIVFPNLKHCFMSNVDLGGHHPGHESDPQAQSTNKAHEAGGPDKTREPDVPAPPRQRANNAWMQQVITATAFIAGICFLMTIPGRFFPGLDLGRPELVAVIFEALNFAALMIFCLASVKAPKLEFKLGVSDGLEGPMEKYSRLLQLENVGKAEFNNIRVNRLVKQLNNNIIYYALTLMVVYLVYILQHFKNYGER